jgi:16S rRNA processing protein RimM
MRVVVGRIGRAQGLRGEVTVEVRTDAPEERFSPGALLYSSGRRGVSPQLRVAATRWQGNKFIIGIEGVTDRNGAEALRDTLLEADVDLLDTGEDEYHDLVLVGLLVRTAEGAEIGKVSEVLHLPSQDVLVVAATDDRPEVLIPFVSEIVTDVDVAGGFAIVEMPPGLDNLAES